jgi:hypothetical protein
MKYRLRFAAAEEPHYVGPEWCNGCGIEKAMVFDSAEDAEIVARRIARGLPPFPTTEEAIKARWQKILVVEIDSSIPTPPLSVTIEDGKYTVIQEADGHLHALRNGVTWRDLTGDNLILCLAQEVQRLREQLQDAHFDGDKAQ